jgi:hypothetical protein
MFALLFRAVPASRGAIIASALLFAACGRVGFATSGATGDAGGGSDTGDPSGHLHTVTGWSISQLVDLGAGFSYVQQDFMDDMAREVRDNAPSYVAALYPPFSGELAVIAGRSVIEIAASGHMTTHDYRPKVPDTDGPDAPNRMTFADFGNGDAALWLGSSSRSGGDGLYRIASDWSMQGTQTLNGVTLNNVNALVFDAGGSFDAPQAPSLYFNAGQKLERKTAAAAMQVNTVLPTAVDDFAVIGNALYFTAEIQTQTQTELDRLGPGTSYLQSQLNSTISSDLTLAEGSVDAGLFAIHNASALVEVDPASGAFTQVAWSDDPAWVWRAACVPRANHRLTGHVIVIESNRMLDRDRLLVITPP